MESLDSEPANERTKNVVSASLSKLGGHAETYKSARESRTETQSEVDSWRLVPHI